MWVYFLLLIPPALVGAAHHLAPRLRPQALLAAGLLLALFIGLRREVGGDWDNYLLIVQRAALLPFADAMAQTDPAYALLSRAVAQAGLDVGVVNLICAALLVAGTLSLARSLPLPHVALVAALPVLLMIGGFAPTRQATAVGIFMLALPLLATGKKGMPAALLVLACLFHWTAAVLLPLVPLMLLRRAPPTWMIVAAGGLGALALIAAFVTIPAAAERLGSFRQSGGALLRAVPVALALGLFALAPRRLAPGEEDRRIAAYLAALSLGALLLVPVVSTVGDRLAFYAVPFQMLVLARAPGLLPAGRLRLAAEALAMLPHLLLFAGWLAATSYRPCLIPYRTYLADPAALRFEPPELSHRSAACRRVMTARSPAPAAP